MNVDIQLNNTSTIEDLTIKGVRIAQVSAGVYHTLAIDASGNLWAWGLNEYGQLGNGNTTNSSVPIQIMSGTKFKSATATFEHTLVIDSNGNLWAFGRNDSGQLGNGTITYGSNSTPAQVKSGTTFSIVSAGSTHNLAIDTSGNLWAWGSNNYGQLGDETTTDSSIPIQIKSDTKFSNVSAGDYYTLAIDNFGNVLTWGDNKYGQLGNSDIFTYIPHITNIY